MLPQTSKGVECGERKRRNQFHSWRLWPSQYTKQKGGIWRKRVVEYGERNCLNECFNRPMQPRILAKTAYTRCLRGGIPRKQWWKAAQTFGGTWRNTYFSTGGTWRKILTKGWNVEKEGWNVEKDSGVKGGMRRKPVGFKTLCIRPINLWLQDSYESHLSPHYILRPKWFFT